MTTASTSTTTTDEPAGAHSGPPARPPARARTRRLAGRLAQPVDGASLAAFRIAFGLVVLWESLRYLSGGRVARYWVDVPVQFTYVGFGWVQPLPEQALIGVWVGIGVCGALLAAGLWQRAAAAAFTLAFGYSFLLEATRYLNHHYLMLLLGALLVVVPADRVWSVRHRGVTVPAWALRLLQAQVALVYVFGGLAKLNGDWLLRGQPLVSWLPASSDMPVLGPLLAAGWVVPLFAVGSAAFDLLVVPALVWRPTRPVAVAAAALFHGLNAALFHIGVFPVLAMAATLLFCAPSWPRDLLRRVAPARAGPAAGHGPLTTLRQPGVSAAGLVLLATFLAVQVVVPLRHHAAAGEASWTEEGHRAAWRMKLRSKTAAVAYTVRDPATGQRWLVEPHRHLPGWQRRKMETRPELLRQYAHHLAEQARHEGVAEPQVYVWACVAPNARPPALLVDPMVDLGAQSWRPQPPWVPPSPEAAQPCRLPG